MLVSFQQLKVSITATPEERVGIDAMLRSGTITGREGGECQPAGYNAPAHTRVHYTHTHIHAHAYSGWQRGCAADRMMDYARAAVSLTVAHAHVFCLSARA